jgi:hypothetical protein
MAKNQSLTLLGYVNFLVIRWIKIQYMNKITEAHILTLPHWDIAQSMYKGLVLYIKESYA